MTIGDELLEEWHQRRHGGNPRLSEDDRAILRRITTGDLADEFQAALDADLEADPALSGRPDPDHDD